MGKKILQFYVENFCLSKPVYLFSLPIDSSNYPMYYGPSKYDASGYVYMKKSLTMEVPE